MWSEWSEEVPFSVVGEWSEWSSAFSFALPEINDPPTIAIPEANQSLVAGAISFQFSAVVTDEDDPLPTPVWSSSNTLVATVNSSGVVRPLSAGIATITATVTDSGDLSASASRTVTVAAAPFIAPSPYYRAPQVWEACEPETVLESYTPVHINGVWQFLRSPVSLRGGFGEVGAWKYDGGVLRIVENGRADVIMRLVAGIFRLL
jgi:hypothetical protein